ncbi:MAG: dipeptide/oligopeptide/nickel ABC transporter ATP-binding protein [Planctomycetota bacterium]|nr:dipeptide/oligopeptide/nickel ABC transporter ATP-binding protein [Planctomycetota bacterium]
MTDVLLELRDAVVEHRREALFGRGGSTVRALDGVSLTLRSGEVVAVVGASGAGKSTLARAALGLERLVSGSVSWSLAPGAAPVDLARLSTADVRAARPRFQPVFQDPKASLDPRWTARATLREALAARAARVDFEREGRALLERVGLEPGHLERLPHQLSGGEAQRLCIARALAAAPDVLVLDEPVAALDASVQAQVLDLFADLRRDWGLSYLLIAHDPRLVDWMADRVVVLEQGRITGGN